MALALDEAELLVDLIRRDLCRIVNGYDPVEFATAPGIAEKLEQITHRRLRRLLELRQDARTFTVEPRHAG